MKKRISLLLIIFICVFLISGCTSQNKDLNNNNNSENKSTVYKYIKISSDNAANIINNAYIFDEPSVVGSGDTEYKPCLIAEYDITTGKASKVKFYSFFLDNDDDKWVDKAIDKYNTSSGQSKKAFSNVSKGRVNENVSFLTADVDPSSYVFNQYVESLLRNQDIKKYKDEIYYSRLYNYDTKPPVEEGNNYFEESLESIRIEWSNNKLSSY